MSKKPRAQAAENDTEEDLADFKELPEGSQKMMGLREENKETRSSQ